jgi:hypothetical protein
VSGDGYSYTTISARLGEPTLIDLSFYLDEHARVEVLGAENGRPFLSISHGDVSVVISPRRESRTALDAQIARKVADQAALYADEVERLCAAHETDSAAA